MVTAIAGFKLKSLNLEVKPGKQSQHFNATPSNITGYMLTQLTTVCEVLPHIGCLNFQHPICLNTSQ